MWTKSEPANSRKRKLWLIEIVLCIPLVICLAVGGVAAFVLASEGIWTFQGGALVAGLFSIAGLCVYGIWRLDREATMLSRELRKTTGKVSKLWYLAPLIGLLGGLWAYRELRNTDPELAKTLLFAGAVATVLFVIRDYVLI